MEYRCQACSNIDVRRDSSCAYQSLHPVNELPLHALDDMLIVVPYVQHEPRVIFQSPVKKALTSLPSWRRSPHALRCVAKDTQNINFFCNGNIMCGEGRGREERGRRKGEIRREGRERTRTLRLAIVLYNFSTPCPFQPPLDPLSTTKRTTSAKCRPTLRPTNNATSFAT